MSIEQFIAGKEMWRERERKKLNILGTRASRKDVLMYKSCCDCLHILLIEERGRRGK